MAKKKTSLRDFQQYLAGRLTTAAEGGGTSSWLGIESGNQLWLADLSESGEIVQAPQLVSVPLTHPWFSGLANIRGNLYAVSDFSRFRGGPSTPMNASSRLLLIGTRFGSNAALLVNRMSGLKNPEDFTQESQNADAPAWGAVRYSDAQGKIWHKLSVRELLADRDFMNIGL